MNFQSSPNYENPTDEDTDNQYDVTIHASDGANTSSLQVVVSVTNVRHDPDELPVITGTARVGETLTVDTSPIRKTDENTTFGYAWIRTDGGTDTTIEGANSSSYTLTDTDEGKNIKVQLGFWTKRSEFLHLISAPTEVVAKPNSPATGAPTISGTAQVDQTLTADTSGITDTDGLTNVSYEYQWIAGGTDIDGATGSGHTLTASEQGKAIQVRVAFTDDRNNPETLTSAATLAVAAKPVPLTATFTNVPSSHSGSGEFTFDLAFSESLELSYITLRDHAFTEDDHGVRSPERSGRCRAATRPGRSPSNPAATAQSPSPCPRPPTAPLPGPSAPATDASCRTQPRSQSQARDKPARLQEPPVRARTGTGRTGANIK